MRKSRIAIFILAFIAIGIVLPQPFVNPVTGATTTSFHPKSFWYYPWGKSGTHKGVDIFAKEGTRVVASTTGIVLFTGDVQRGGNVVVVLGSKWRIHYYAHLQKINASWFSFLSTGETLGNVGTTGNAKGKPAHLHYSIATLIPYPWRIDSSVQGWKKMFYLNPIDYLNGAKN
jgi:peptidoglycan LD-endopeptidase LytH